MPPVSTLSTLFPPSPKFTERNLPSLVGKIYIVTGAASGVGFELAKFLYGAGGTVYVAARSTSRCEGAIQKILQNMKSKHNIKSGKLESLVMDLSDLESTKSGVEYFLSRETRLDVLMHNAGVMTPPKGSKDKHGHDLEIGTNCLAPYLMTLLLEPILIRTANTPGTSANSVRVVFVISCLQEGYVPGGAMTFDANGTPVVITDKFMANYMQSKNGGAWLALHFAERLGKHGILSVSLHPGLMKTDLQRHWGPGLKLVMAITSKSPVYGAYSEIYAGFSPEVTPEHNGAYLMAWGRIGELASDVKDGWKSEAKGGTGAAKKFLEYCDRETKEYL
ncbi:hypothetical protein ONS95_008803 [Cadophora gregata]|uniref:uncharacterized protein n=1 Tax=Cadophora gregata TaxID=51156 RepID=UPI0026DD9045|nr:uncharacterized protein ONS95_008803 [Cadophora gregata]KAK0123802.1 hypothetical protein ONS95_008803 [Cadophora gregata]